MGEEWASPHSYELGWKEGAEGGLPEVCYR